MTCIGISQIACEKIADIYPELIDQRAVKSEFYRDRIKDLLSKINILTHNTLYRVAGFGEEYLRPDTGVVRYAGRELTGPDPGIQIIFQDPAGSFNPVWTVYQSLSAVLTLTGIPRSDHPNVLLDHFQRAGLQTEILSRYPDQISGGQAQRVAIVRGMLVQPKVMILDEPTSALDVSVQAQILHLLKHIQEEHDMAYVFISHDPSVVAFMADRVIGI